MCKNKSRSYSLKKAKPNQQNIPIKKNFQNKTPDILERKIVFQVQNGHKWMAIVAAVKL